MKKALIVVLIAAGGLIVYNYSTTGQMTLFPTAGSSEEQAVITLSGRFEAARRQILQAQKGAAVAGLDTTSDFESARIDIQKVATELDTLRKGLQEEKARHDAETLAVEIAAYLKNL